MIGYDFWSPNQERAKHKSVCKLSMKNHKLMENDTKRAEGLQEFLSRTIIILLSPKREGKLNLCHSTLGTDAKVSRRQLFQDWFELLFPVNGPVQMRDTWSDKWRLILKHISLSDWYFSDHMRGCWLKRPLVLIVTYFAFKIIKMGYYSASWDGKGPIVLLLPEWCNRPWPGQMRSCDHPEITLGKAFAQHASDLVGLQ